MFILSLGDREQKNSVMLIACPRHFHASTRLDKHDSYCSKARCQHLKAAIIAMRSFQGCNAGFELGRSESPPNRLQSTHQIITHGNHVVAIRKSVDLKWINGSQNMRCSGQRQTMICCSFHPFPTQPSTLYMLPSKVTTIEMLLNCERQSIGTHGDYASATEIIRPSTSAIDPLRRERPKTPPG